MAEMTVSFAREKLLPLIIDEAKFLWGIPGEFVDIKKELEYIQAFLKDADRRATAEGDDANEGIKKWVKDLREASFRIEDVVDEYMMYVEQQPDVLGCAAFLFECNIAPFIESLKRRHQLASEIQHIKSLVRGINNRSKEYGFQFQPCFEQGQSSYGDIQSGEWSNPPLDARYPDEAELVGIEGPRDVLISLLVGEPAKRAVISLAGMGGLGKTTLASRVFNNEKVIAYFAWCAWITVSQPYTPEGLLRRLLPKLCQYEMEEPPQNVSEMDLDSLIHTVRGYLKRKRYAVVFDVWSVALWGQIKHAMLDVNNGSRILITTRKKDVVESFRNSPFDKEYELKPLSPKQSMELFRKKAFQFHNDGHCPEDLKELSSYFVKKCEVFTLYFGCV